MTETVTVRCMGGYRVNKRLKRRTSCEEHPLKFTVQPILLFDIAYANPNYSSQMISGKEILAKDTSRGRKIDARKKKRVR